MVALLWAFGVCFVLRGIFTFLGRSIPKNVIEKLQEPEKIKGWCQGTGIVHILWGGCSILIWCTDTFSEYTLYLLAGVIICAVSSIIIALRTTKRYTNKK